MNEVTKELIGLCRYFGIYEREAVCCGTVTVQQCVVLQDLLEGSRDIKDLAQFAGVTSSAMTRLVDGLEKRGWVRRIRQDEDRRRVMVELRAQGRREAARLRDLTETAVQAVMSQIPKDKHAQVLESMRLVRTAMEASSEAVAACCGAS